MISKKKRIFFLSKNSWSTEKRDLLEIKGFTGLEIWPTKVFTWKALTNESTRKGFEKQFYWFENRDVEGYKKFELKFNAEMEVNGKSGLIWTYNNLNTNQYLNQVPGHFYTR